MDGIYLFRTADLIEIPTNVQEGQESKVPNMLFRMVQKSCVWIEPTSNEPLLQKNIQNEALSSSKQVPS